MQRKTGGAQEQVRLVKRANMRTNDREEEQQEATTPVLRILLRGAQKQRHPSHCGSPTAKHRKGLWESHSAHCGIYSVGLRQPNTLYILETPARARYTAYNTNSQTQ